MKIDNKVYSKEMKGGSTYMTNEFYEKLNWYFFNVGKVLRGEAEASSIFPNAIDKGMTREKIYQKFLESHLPSNCNLFLGGFLFDLDGKISNQLDIIVTSDSSPQYNIQGKEGIGKSFACIEGTIGVFSIKSNLDSKELNNALDNIASLPDKRPLDNNKPPNLEIPTYEDWPFKVIFAFDGPSVKHVKITIDKFYRDNSSISNKKRPNLIHVLGKYSIIRTDPIFHKTRDGTDLPLNIFHEQLERTDVWALNCVILRIQQYASLSRLISFPYHEIIDKLPLLNYDI